MNKQVSISLCTYNGAKYLSQQLDSYLAQTRPPDEIVVCDDRSRDETASIIRDFESQAPFPVRFYQNEKNLGVVKNFEKAISLCEGEVIFLSDQDDVWAPEKIERMMIEFENDPELGQVFTNAELVDENLAPLDINLWDMTFRPEQKRLAGTDSLFALLLKINVVTGATQAFRKDLRRIFSPILDYQPRYVHDAWIALSIAMVAKSLYLEDRLIKYRQHPGQLVGVPRQRALRPKVNWKTALDIVIESLTIRKSYLLEFAERHRAFLDAPHPYLDQLAAEIDLHSDKIAHFGNRRKLADSALGRISPIAKEIYRGRYRRYSNGVRSIIRDLLVTESFMVNDPEDFRDSEGRAA